MKREVYHTRNEMRKKSKSAMVSKEDQKQKTKNKKSNKLILDLDQINLNDKRSSFKMT